MSHELYYTSAPKGLRPGSRGFCTVAATQGLPAPLAEKLESLSGYRPIYPPLDAKAHLNPVAQSHVRITAAGKTYSVVSRISPAGLDYSQRANKFAHHVILETGELPAAGPAWLLGRSGFMESQWDGEVRIIPSGRGIPDGDQGPSVCRAWQEVTGDAGWGGVLADWFQRDPNRQVYVVIEPGMDPLPLIAETLALLTPERRWQVTFSTYFTGLPQGIPCLWRCVIKDSPEAVNSSRVRGQQIVNLCEPLGPAPDGNLVELARTGRKGARGVVPSPTAVATSSDPAAPWPGQATGAGHQPDHRAWKRAAYEVEPVQTNQGAPSPSINPSPPSRGGEGRRVRSSPPAKRGRQTWLWPALAGLICGLGSGILAASLWWRPLAVTGLLYESVPKENGAIAADEKEIKNPEKSVQQSHEKSQAKDKEFKEVSESLTKTKEALAKEKQKGAKLAAEKKEKENTIAELQDELRKLKQPHDSSKQEPGGLGQSMTAVADGYFRLPDWSKSSINENKLKADKSIKNFDLEPGQDYNLKLLVADSSNLESADGVSSIKVGLRGGATFAKFDLKDGKLSFHWDPQAEDKYESAQASLRNCLLEISSAGKSRKIALREPVSDKETEITFPSLKTGGQDVYTSTADFLSWGNQGPPSGEVLFDSVRLEIDKASFTQDNPSKKPFQTLVFGESVKQFKWGVVGKSQDGDHVGSLTLGPSNPLRKPAKVRMVFLVAYIEVHGVYVEVARIGKTAKK